MGLFGEQTNTTSGPAATARAIAASVMTNGSSISTGTSAVDVSLDSRECSRYVGSKTTAVRPGPP